MGITRAELMARMSWDEILDHLAEKQLTNKEQAEANGKNKGR